jgi:TolB protein
LWSGAVPVACLDGTGRYVIFSGRFGEDDVDHLYEITAAGKELRKVSYAPAPDVAPACSPDGVHVAFASGRTGGNEIWICERVHGEFTQITKSGGAYAAPGFSPDGRQLVASRKVAPGGADNFDLWTMTARGRWERPIAETFYNEIEPAFGAGGDRVYFASSRYGNWDIFSSDLKGGKLRRLTGPDTEDRMPAPSPGGEYVVYTGRTADGPYKLWAMNVDGSSKVPLTSGPGDDLYPRFSRTGDALVFVSSRTGSFEVYRMTFEQEPDYDLPRPPRPLVRTEIS